MSMDNTQVLPTIGPNDNWPTAFAKLRFIMNLTYKDQDILVAREHIDTPLDNLIRNRHYFVNEDSLKQYVHRKYGWEGTTDDRYIFTRGEEYQNLEILHQESIGSPAVESSSACKDDNISEIWHEELAGSPAVESSSAYHVDSQSEISHHESVGQSLVQSSSAYQVDNLSPEQPNHFSNDSSPESPESFREIKRNLFVENSWTVDDDPSRHAHDDNSESCTDRAINMLSTGGLSKKHKHIQKKDLSLGDRLQKSLQDMTDASSNPSFFHDEVEKVDEIMTLLRYTLQDMKSSFIFISGPPGTGKCMEKCQGIHPGLKQCYLNGSSFSINPQSVYQHIHKNIFNINSSDCRANMLSKKLGVKNHRLPYVVILDEIDFFIDPGKKSNSGNTCIETLVKWASDHSKRFILIGISNSVGDSSAKCITGISQSCKHVIFSPYTDKDLESIVIKRLGNNRCLVDPESIKYASKKIANDSGDARQIMCIFQNAISEVLQTMDTRELLDFCPEEKKCHHVIKTGQIHQLLNSAKSQMEEIISSLPTNAQMILAILCTLGETLDEWKNIRANVLKQYCFKAEEAHVLFFFSTSSFWSSIELLENSGLIAPEDLNGRWYDEEDDDNRFIIVGKEKNEISSTIKRVIPKEHRPFFDRLAQYVKANPIDDASEDDY